MLKYEMKARYPAPSKVVIKMFTDKEFHTRKLDQMGLKYRVLAHSDAGKDFSIKIERKVPIQMPGIGKSAGETTIVNEERWNAGNKTGAVVVEAQGMPLEVSCITEIADEGKECVVTYQWSVHSKLPLVGGTLEKFVVADMEKRAADETRISVAMLKDYK